MGLFNNYMKPGKGVSKDEPEKKGFFLYWDILFHRFSKILGSNCLLMLTSLLWLAILMFMYMQFIVPITPEKITGFLQDMGGGEDIDAIAQAMILSLYIMFSVITFTFLGSGPVSASYAYIMKCFTNRQHAWIVSDGWDKFKENFKQSMVVVIIDIVVLFLVPIALRFYYSKLLEGNAVFGIPCYILAVAIIVFTWMHFYIYQIMVTYECTLKQLYKNALIFALGKLPMNIVLSIIGIGVTAAPYLVGLNPFIAIVISGTIGLCFTRFAIEFYASRSIKKTAIISEQKDDAADKDDNQQDAEAVFDDDIASKINDRTNSEVKR